MKNFKELFQRYSGIFKIGLSALLLWFVFRNIDLVSLGKQILLVSPFYLLSFLAISIVIVWLASIRWSWLLLGDTTGTKTGSRVSDFFRASMIGFFYNLFMPTAIGGDAIKWTHLSHLGVSKKRLIFSTLLDRVIGVMALVIVGSISALYASQSQIFDIPPQVSQLFMVLSVALIIFIALVLIPFQISSLPVFKNISLLVKLEKELEKNRGIFVKTIAISLVIQVMSYLAQYVLAYGAGFDVSWLSFMVLGPVIALILVLPISFSGFGAMEVAFIYFFGQLGVAKETILVFTSLFVIFKLIMGLGGWLISLMPRKLSV